MPETFLLVQKLVLATLLGIMVGLDREKRKEEQKETSFGGIRTYPMISLLGALSVVISQYYASSAVLVMSFSALVLILIATHVYQAFVWHHGGITAELSAILTFFIGVTTMLFPVVVPITIAIVLALLLALKKQLHDLSHNVWEEEFYAVIKFLLITFVVLPFLPNETIDPWQLINPYKVWSYAVIISAISFAGYIAVKLIGPERGIHSTGFIGGIVSSTSVCSIYAKRAKESPKLLYDYSNGALLSYISSIIKVALVIFVLNQKLFYAVLPSLATLIIFGCVLWIISMKQHNGKKPLKDKVEFHNPFTLSFGIKFALALTVVLTLAQFAQKYFGTAGIYIISFLSGLAKIDAITVTMANLAGKSVDYEIATRAIMIGVFFSAAAKCLYGYIFGGGKFVRALAPYLLATGLSGLVVSFI